MKTHKLIDNAFATFMLLGLVGFHHVSAQHDPAQPFTGTTTKLLSTSKPGVYQYKSAPKGSPNIVWILLDDVGFGATSAFGGLIQTPTLDSLANHGLRYSNFHVEAYCAPTRAALLTGRNHHSVHVGLFPETAVEYPGYDARIPFEKGTIAEVLRENGYNTYAIGKWHITPVRDATQAGPFNRWPTGRGFDHYLGFLFAETDQFHPQLVEDNLKVEPDTKGKTLNALLADKAISYIGNQKSLAPEKPFFLYYATGAMHEPHQVDAYWSDKYKNKFNGGWDKYREVVLENQKKLGVVPKDAVLPPPNPGARPWNKLSAEEKKAYLKFFEVYAGFLTETDYEIGRVVKYLKQINQLENTAIFVVVGDNGASGEGTESGYVSGWSETLTDEGNVKQVLLNYNKIGTENSKPNYPRGWATATSTPFRFWKGYANAEGGTHVPLIAFYPKTIKEKGVRNQYTHIIDLLPTTLELTNAVTPKVINGYPQDSVEGVSFLPTFKNADIDSKHIIQYYEVAGKRAVYKDGWKAGVAHKDGSDFNKDVWELYNITTDFNEKVNVAAKYPEKLKELQQLFETEAQKYNIYPLKDWSNSGWNDGKSIYNNANKIVLYPGISQIFGLSGPILRQKSFSITAEADIPSANTEGALFAFGGSFDGIGLFIKNGKLYATHNNSNYDNTTNSVTLESNKNIPIGKVNLRYELNYTNPIGKYLDPAGTESIYINNEKVGERTIQKYQAEINTYDEGIDIGKDLNTPISNLYKVPFEFTGTLHTVTIEYK